jgi:hypothetical protein
MTARRTRTIAVVGALVSGYLALPWLGHNCGSTAAERRTPMPGDELVRHPQVGATHATTIPAAPHSIWPWLVQVLKVGDFVPDGPPATECGFVVREVEPRRLLLLESTTHLQLSWRQARVGTTVLDLELPAHA